MVFTYYKKVLTSRSMSVQEPTLEEITNAYENDPVLRDFVDHITACFIRIIVEHPF